MPSNGAFMLLGAGFVVPAVIAWLADKNDSSDLPEVLFVLAVVVFFTGLVRMILSDIDREE
jgi:4-hydroxybenzoate polyprenyltransferase